MSLDVLLGVLCASFPALTLYLFATKARPGLWRELTLWALGILWLLTFFASNYGLHLLARRQDGFVFDILFPSVWFMSVLSVAIMRGDWLRFHWRFVEYFDDPRGVEYVVMTTLEGQVRSYLQHYPGTTMTLRKDLYVPYVVMEVKGKRIATIRVPERSAGGVLRDLHQLFQREAETPDLARLQSVALTYRNPWQYEVSPVYDAGEKDA